jgi:hypothetical protein
LENIGIGEGGGHRDKPDRRRNRDKHDGMYLAAKVKLKEN